jgi:hypothetical protein
MLAACRRVSSMGRGSGPRSILPRYRSALITVPRLAIPGYEEKKGEQSRHAYMEDDPSPDRGTHAVAQRVSGGAPHRYPQDDVAEAYDQWRFTRKLQMIAQPVSGEERATLRQVPCGAETLRVADLCTQCAQPPPRF